MGGTDGPDIKALTAAATAAGLSPLSAEEARRAAEWERGERPYPWSAAQLTDGGVERVWALRDGGAVVAYAAIRTVLPEAHLVNLMTDPARRRQGWGAAILQKVMIVLRRAGVTTVWLDVDPDNASAVALYRKAGFTTVERRRGAYPRGESAEIMRRDL